MTPLLMSPENPDGWKLEELFDRLIAEIEVKCTKISGDPREVARQVLENNRNIIGMLRLCATTQRQSMAALDTIGPNQGPLGKPRIGVGSD